MPKITPKDAKLLENYDKCIMYCLNSLSNDANFTEILPEERQTAINHLEKAKMALDNIKRHNIHARDGT